MVWYLRQYIIEENQERECALPFFGVLDCIVSFLVNGG